jgi:hypothetical protein
MEEDVPLAAVLIAIGGLPDGRKGGTRGDARPARVHRELVGDAARAEGSRPALPAAGDRRWSPRHLGGAFPHLLTEPLVKLASDWSRRLAGTGTA